MKKIYPKSKARVRGKTAVRHTHSTIAALEDALAVAWDVILEQERCNKYVDGRTRRILEILQQARKGPYAYDPDTPSGLRVKIRER